MVRRCECGYSAVAWVLVVIVVANRMALLSPPAKQQKNIGAPKQKHGSRCITHEQASTVFGQLQGKSE